MEIILPNSSQSISLANGLLRTSQHTLTLYLKSSVQTIDRWENGPIDRLCIKGLQLEDGGRLVPNPLLGKRTMIYWDSIGEGVNVLGAGNGDLEDNDRYSVLTYYLC
jgi:hypothetical protein